MAETTELELQSPAAEKALIGAASFTPDALGSVLADLPAEDFYDPHRAAVWSACRHLSGAREPITPMSVVKHLRSINQLTPAAQRVVQVDMSTAAPASFARRHADEVSDLARRRELIRTVNRTRQIVTQHPGNASDILAAVRGVIADVDFGDEPQTGPQGWDALIDEFRDVHREGGSRPGIPSPWYQLDEYTGGFYGGRQYVFGGRPGEGKSTAAFNIAMHAASESRLQTLVVSREMPAVDVTGRFLASGAQVPLLQINARRLTRESKDRIEQYIDRVGRPTITVDARPRGLAGIKTLARAHAYKHGLDVLIVDYLQLIRTEAASRTREQEVAEVSMQLKALALELDCVNIIPAQLNRGLAQRSDRRPVMSDLRDSGQIEQDADAVVLLHREVDPEGVHTGVISFILDKNRHGPTATVSLEWRGSYGRIA